MQRRWPLWTALTVGLGAAAYSLLLPSVAPLWVRVTLTLAGTFSLLLGTVHVVLPALLGYERAVTTPAHPFRLGPVRYETVRQDLVGLIWVMNHHTSMVLISIGLVSLFAGSWLRTAPGSYAALWIALWWLLRAANQLYLGARLGDRLLIALFGLLGAAYLGVALL